MDLFTVSLPFLTSLVHTAAALTVIDTLAAIAAASLSVFPTQQTTTQIIRDFTESHYQYCVCVCVSACAANMYKKGL